MTRPERDDERDDEVEDWARSGAVWLTGRADGPPLVPPGRGATYVRESLADLGLAIPGILGERAAYAGLTRSAPWSCGGAFRIVRTADGWIGVALPRASDVDLVPALVESDVEQRPWHAVTSWAARTPGAVAEERLRLLGLAGGLIPSRPPTDRPAVMARPLGRRRSRDTPLIVDLTSMWPGPLCAHLLGLKGARVVKVESTDRPDAARSGSPEFFSLLHADHEQITLDFRADIDQLRELVESADLVLEASRPRALRQLGIAAEEVVARGTSWLSITAHGRESDAIGFGDDVAASAGLVIVQEDGSLAPAGDALADPLTGVAAAVAAWQALGSDETRLIDVSMRHVVAETLGRTVPTAPPLAATPSGDGSWWLPSRTGPIRVEPPQRRPLPRRR